MDLATVAVIVGLIMNFFGLVVAIFKGGRIVEKFEQIGSQQAEEIKELKEEVKIIGEIVTKMAVQHQRQDSLEARMDRHEQTIEDLRRGEGYILEMGNRFHPSVKP
jgi:cell division protein FtsB